MVKHDSTMVSNRHKLEKDFAKEHWEPGIPKWSSVTVNRWFPLISRWLWPGISVWLEVIWWACRRRIMRVVVCNVESCMHRCGTNNPQTNLYSLSIIVKGKKILNGSLTPYLSPFTKNQDKIDENENSIWWCSYAVYWNFEAFVTSNNFAHVSANASCISTDQNNGLYSQFSKALIKITKKSD